MMLDGLELGKMTILAAMVSTAMGKSAFWALRGRLRKQRGGQGLLEDLIARD
jgi:hypothetical protein